jgi:exodeoxyribonuclease-3
MQDVTPRLPGGDGDDHARYIEAIVPSEKGAIRVASIYAPNGNPIATEKFTYKLGWLERLRLRAKELLRDEEPQALMGDYNVIPMPDDVYNPKAWEKDALYQPESRAALRRIENIGYTDAIRACHHGPHLYTFWDYQAGAWQKDHGIRIDHIMLSPNAADCLKASGVDKHVRGREKPSDHVPVWCELAI